MQPPRIITTLTATAPAPPRPHDVEIAGGRALDELPRLQLVEARDLVAQPRGALELERRAPLIHLRLELRENLVRLPLQE
jgi:hypothetical protein